MSKITDLCSLWYADNDYYHYNQLSYNFQFLDR